MRQQIRDQISEDMLAELLQRWGANVVAELAGGAMNLIYEVTVGNQPRIFRITDGSWRSAAIIDAELHWITHLKRCGITVCAPIASNDGLLLETVQGDQRQFFAAAFERARGVPVRRHHLNRSHMIALGRLLADLHAASAAYPQVSRMNWDYNLSGLCKLVLNDAEVHDRLVDAAEQIDTLPRDCSSFGLIHNDLHMQNYYIDDGAIWLFDFDSCLYNWFASDIACTWYFALSWTAGSDRAIWHKMQQPMLSALLAGYRQVSPVLPAWVEHIPLFFRYRALSLYAYMNKRYGKSSVPRERARARTARCYAATELPDMLPFA